MMDKIDMVLKLVETPAVMLVERFKIQWPSGTLQDLHVVMTLKGMKKQEQRELLEALGLGEKEAAGVLGGEKATMYEKFNNFGK